jgi:hypothetical protein
VSISALKQFVQRSYFVINVFRYSTSSPVHVVKDEVAINYIIETGEIALTTAQHITTYCRVHAIKRDTVLNNTIYTQRLTIKASIDKLQRPFAK